MFCFLEDFLPLCLIFIDLFIVSIILLYAVKDFF